MNIPVEATHFTRSQLILNMKYHVYQQTLYFWKMESGKWYSWGMDSDGEYVHWSMSPKEPEGLTLISKLTGNE